MLIEKYNAKEIFDDSGTLMTGEWLKELCRGLIERRYNKKIKYSCNMRFNALKQEDFYLMKKAGFRLLKFGLESANQRTLDRLNKGIKVEDILKGCEMAKKAGLTVHLTMIVGYPWESKEDALRTFELAKRLMQSGKADLLQATILVPYPGTPLWKEAKENNGFLFNPLEYERYDMREPVLKTGNSNIINSQNCSDSERAKEIISICGQIYTIFLTPSYIFQRIKNVKSWNDFKFNLRGVKAVLGHLKDFGRKNGAH
jgi:anaerobic magnesium-protoporphyrin IX monomethyl ester cyclase